MNYLSFKDVRQFLKMHGPVRLFYNTNNEIQFEASACKCKRGNNSGKSIIRVKSGKATNILIYECDWGHDYTKMGKGGTLIRHCTEPLNEYVIEQLNH